MLDLYIFPLYRVVDPLQPELPGFLVVPPEKEGGRGREGDLLTLYITLNRPEAYNSLALKSMLQAAVALYRKAHGTVTSGLRLMADHLNGILLESNLRGGQNGEPTVALLNLVAIRDNILYIAQCGPTHSIFINPDVVQDFSDPLTSGRGLGATSALNLKYYQVEASAGDVFVMAPNPPEAWNHESLTGSNQLTLEHLRKRLLNQAQPDLQAVVIKFQTGPGQVHVLRPRGAQVPAAPIAPAPVPQPAAAPAPVQAAPPSQAAETAGVQTSPAPSVQPAAEPLPAEKPTAKDLPDSQAPVTTAPPVPGPSEETPAVEPAIAPPPFPVPAPDPSQPLTRADRLRLARARAAGGAVEPAPPVRPSPPPPQRPAPAPIEPLGVENEVSVRRLAPRVKPVPAPRPRSAGRKRLAGVWLAWKSFFKRIGAGVSKLTGRLSPARPSQAPALSAATMLFIAVAIPLVVVAVALTFYLQTGRSDQRNAFYRQALEFSAAAVQQTDTTLQHNDWTQAITWLDKAEAISVTADSTALRKRIQLGLDAADGILRLDFKPVVRYELPTGTKITRMVASSSDIYLLDSSQGRVLRLFLTGTGYELDKLFKCGPGPSGSLSVGSLVDMVILPPNNRKATVLATDANGVLLYCIPGTPPYSNRLTPPDNGWGKAVAIALDSDTLFVLDVLNNAVWVYDGKNVEFGSTPRLFFDKETPSLSNVADLAFYGDDLYLLRNTGTLTLCTLSNVAFAPTRCKDPANFGDPRQGHDPSPTKFADASFSQIITTQPPDPSLYMLDANGPGIYHFSLLLNFQHQLRASTAPDVRIPTDAPTAFAISPTRQAILAFGNQIYYGLLP